MKTLKICLVILCLLHVRAVGLPQFSGANFFMETEVWKDVVGYEGFYIVSSFGRVHSNGRMAPVANPKSKKTRFIKPSLLKTRIANTGYPCVTLTTRGVSGQINIHRLVAEAFIPNPDNLPQVNHKDFDKTNNNISNLEWVTIKGNVQHAALAGRRKLKVVNQYSLSGDFVRSWPNMNRVAVELGISGNNIWKCCYGIIKQTHGYKFSFK